MDIISPKLLLTDLEGNHYIRFTSPRLKLFIRIFEYDAPEILLHHEEQFSQWHEENNLPYLGAATSLGDKHYLLIAVEAELIKGNSANALAHRMRRLADWYRYTYLIPTAKGTLSNT